ncbi:MAG: phosphate acyltransferase PlsX [candidate division Zixibacteria bacterium]|nr:phosphate acyltransferase PlsX [candidate division Zixibacteria bacterium]
MDYRSIKKPFKNLDPSKKVRIAIDAMGGDYGPSVVVEGAILAAEEYGSGLELVLVGNSRMIEREIERFKIRTPLFDVIHTTESVLMSESATKTYRQKKDSSLSVALQLQKDMKVSATVSAGHTGAVMTHALFTLGRLKGVHRPAIAVVFPSEKDKTVLIDAGANPDCKAQDLYQFGVMGSVYANIIHEKPQPKIGLISIGEESSKGNEVTVNTHKLFTKSELNFHGNIEGRDVLAGTCDVVVCDGFVGNILLKFAESFVGFFRSQAKRQVGKNLLSNIGAFLMRPAMRRVREQMDYAEYGGAPLLGIDGICIICHGGSSPKAIKNAIGAAAVMAIDEINEKIKDKLSINGNLGEDEFTVKSQNNNRIID